MSIFDNPNFKPMDKVAGKPSISVTANGVGFSKQALSKLGYPHFVEIYINKVDKQIAMRACQKENPNSMKFIPAKKEKANSLRWNNPSFREELKSLVSPELAQVNFGCDGEYIAEDDALLFDFTKARPLNK